MAKKYDTNPLDPNFPDKIREQETVTLPKPDGKTSKFPEFAEPEAPTRRYDPSNFNAAANAYNQSQPIAAHQKSYLKDEDRSRKVAKVGLPENILTTLPYLPFYIGFIAGFVELFIVPKSETKVRFHAAQGLAAHIGILIVTAALGIIGNITEIAEVGSLIFGLATFIMLLVWSLKAYQGKPVHIESLDELTNWLEDKIKPQR